MSLTLQLDALPLVPADRVQLRQVLANLITNAIDSMTSVPDRPHILTVRSERLDEWVLISVQDSGTGVAPEQAERVFEAFYTTKPDGIGLGLSISRSIIESHGGRLLASAAQPYGSVFQVLFPTGDRGGTRYLCSLLDSLAEFDDRIGGKMARHLPASNYRAIASAIGEELRDRYQSSNGLTPELGPPLGSGIGCTRCG